LKAMFRDKRDVRFIVRLVRCYCNCVVQGKRPITKAVYYIYLEFTHISNTGSLASHSMHETVCYVYLALNWFWT
jgi:hypothetical protein